jgi:UDP-N-acetyl-D-glucosamine dehydrogenase
VSLTDETLETADCVLIVAGHQAVDYSRVLRRASLVVDTVNATRGLVGPARVVRVGAPLPERTG